MLGAIVGDIIGSTREFHPVKRKDFELFQGESSYTDDSVMTCAVADALLGDGDFGTAMRRVGRHYMDSGYGKRFHRWMDGQIEGPCNSYGNGSAMRVSPVAWAFETEEEVLAAARATALPTHDHPEGIKGAEATALAIFLARKKADKGTIRREMTARFGYDLKASMEEIRPKARFDETCQVTMPEALIAFLDSSGFEDAIRNAVSLGADADTQAAISGSIAEAFYGGVPDSLLAPAVRLLDGRLYGITLAYCGRWRPSEASRLVAARIGLERSETAQTAPLEENNV